MIQSVWKNLTGLQKAQLNTSGVTLNADQKLINTNDLYIHCMDKSTGTPPSLEEKKALPNCGNKDGNIVHVLKNCISTSVATVLKCMKWLYPYVIGVCLVMSFWSAFKVTPEVFSWDQDLAFCRPVKFFHTDWIIISLWSLPYTQRHCQYFEMFS